MIDMRFEKIKIQPLIPRVILSLLLAIPVFSSLRSQEINHWESIVKTGDSVKYIVPDSQLPSAWNTVDYDDSLWSDGIAGIGYGDDDDSTVIEPAMSVYVRYKFTLEEPGAIGLLLLDMDFDDAFVAYLNGLEIARENIGEAYIPPAFDEPALDYHEAVLFDGGQPSQYTIDTLILDALVSGENVFSIEVHNENIGSSDLSSNAFLHAGIKDDSEFFSPVPGWFEWIEPIVFSSQLPVVSINTDGQTISGDYKIVAEMGIIDNGAGQLNHPEDTFNDYDGKISIKVRGSSSQMFPKKSYTIETQTESGDNNNVSLLSLPEENDWVLYAPYSDKTLVRNVISYSIYENMGHWAPRTRYVDLYLNGDYVGVYVLTEKVKRDKNRVDIKKLTEEDVSPVEISGGYILQVDRTSSLAENEYWTTPAVPAINGFSRHTLEYFDPSFDELTEAQSTYIKEWINEFDYALAGLYYTDEDEGYRAYIDVESFVDYMIFHEFNKDVDAYRLSSFFHKVSDFQGGRLHAGPPWDYNLTYGNMDYGDDIRETYNWMYPRTVGIYWWQRLIQDPWFKNQVTCRWDELKRDLLTEDHMHYLIDSSMQVMGPSIDYNFEKWTVLGEYVWPNYFIGETYEEEIDFLKNWISERLLWVDQQWGDACVMTDLDQAVFEPLPSISILPNPSDLSHSRILFTDAKEGDCMLSIFDMNGSLLHQQKLFLHAGQNEMMLDDLSNLTSGVYLVAISRGDGFSDYLKIIKN